MNDNSKESAFGFAAQLSCGEDVYNHGLTKREYFAVMAMQALLSNHEMAKTMRTPDDWDIHIDRVSTGAAEIADALLKALENNTLTETK